jgi:hypothetical protein
VWKGALVAILYAAVILGAIVGLMWFSIRELESA